jgi:hypothetical protein
MKNGSTFGRRGKSSGSIGSQSVFGKSASGGPKGRKTEGQTETPKGKHEPSVYGDIHKHETHFDDGYVEKLGKGKGFSK